MNRRSGRAELATSDTIDVRYSSRTRLESAATPRPTVDAPHLITPFGTTPVPRFLRGERASVSPASVARRTSLAYGCVHARRWKQQVANPRRTHRRHIGLVQETVACPLSRSHQSDGALRRSSGRANGDGNCFGSTTPAADIQPLLRAHDEPFCAPNTVNVSR